jgi:hypothetical protein
VNDELNLCPFERRILGLRGTVLGRHNRQHEKHCQQAISRRDHPRWSSQRDSIRVSAA